MKKILFLLLLPLGAFGQNFLANASAGIPWQGDKFDGFSTTIDIYAGEYFWNPNSLRTSDTMNFFCPLAQSPSDAGRWQRRMIDIMPPTTVTSTTSDTLMGRKNVYNVNATSGNITLTLSPKWQGQEIYVRRVDNTANTVNIAITGSTINGAASVSIPDADRVYTIFYFYSISFIL